MTPANQVTEEMRAYAQKWRDDAFEAAAQIVEKYFGYEQAYCASDIRALKQSHASGGWRAVREHPVLEVHPLADGGKQPDECLLYGPHIGIHKGRVYHWSEAFGGEITTAIAHIGGNAGATHFMPLPEPPHE